MTRDAAGQWLGISQTGEVKFHLWEAGGVGRIPLKPHSPHRPPNTPHPHPCKPEQVGARRKFLPQHQCRLKISLSSAWRRDFPRQIAIHQLSSGGGPGGGWGGSTLKKKKSSQMPYKDVRNSEVPSQISKPHRTAACKCHHSLCRVFPCKVPSAFAATGFQGPSDRCWRPGLSLHPTPMGSRTSHNSRCLPSKTS